MRQTRTVTDPMTPQEFWEEPELVSAYTDAGSALAYELDLVIAATARSRLTGPVDRVTVHGVGGGRELGGIRSVVQPARILAFDLSQPMVDACRRHIDHEGWDDVTAECAAIDDSPVADGSVDLAIALGAVLGYGRTEAEQLAMVDDLRRQCRDGAALAVVVQQRYGRPDWSAYFAACSLLETLSIRSMGAGNRVSRHGPVGTVFHHFSAPELTGLLERAGFGDIRVESLRRWARRNHQKVPLRSPNPLLVLATAS